jgi:hypothetical protein
MGTRVNPLYTGFAARTTPTRPAGGGDLVGGSTAADGRGLTHAGFDSQLMPAQSPDSFLAATHGSLSGWA